MSDKNEWPAHARATLQRYFQKRSAPRTIVSLLLILMGFLAFLVSFVDVFIVSVFYRRLRTAAQEHWLGTALRKTWWLALVAAALLSLAGWILETEAPGCHSIGPSIEKILRG